MRDDPVDHLRTAIITGAILAMFLPLVLDPPAGEGVPPVVWLCVGVLTLWFGSSLVWTYRRWAEM